MRTEVKFYRIGVIVVFALAISISYLHPSVADIITLKAGGEMRGKIIEDTGEGIKLKIKFGEILIKREDIKDVKRGEITDDLILTKDGVKDGWGVFMPPFPYEINMLFLNFESFSTEGKDIYSDRCYSLAEGYEAKAKSEPNPELRQAGLMSALIYYRIAVFNSKKSIKNSSQSAIERCSAQLFSLRKNEIAIPFGPSMNEHINLFIEKLADAKEKEKYANIYLELGRDYEAKSKTMTSPEERLKDLQIAMNCYQIVMVYSSGEETKIKIDKALSGIQQKIQSESQR